MLCQVIEDPVEIIGNDRELKGFYNMDEVIRLVGYFKSEKSARTLNVKIKAGFEKEKSIFQTASFHFKIDFFPFSLRCRFH